ncbi:MAG: hypothetical protein JXB10_12950, partial [Pirellulales bacterium]|nr:hypothetical protein [Pirellulales bacterium]
LAQFDSETRAARLWLGEREAELHQREDALSRSERVVVQRLNRLAAAEEALRRRAAALEESGPSPNSPEERTELDRLREELREQRRRIAAAEQRALAEVEHKRQALRRRSEHLDRCRAALRRLHDELQQKHRETLENRLAAEELWIQLAGSAPPAELTLALGRIRGQLADQYRLAGAELEERKKELEALHGELAVQCEAFTARKKQYEAWAAARQQQLEIQARRLVAREEDLEELRRNCLLQYANRKMQIAN